MAECPDSGSTNPAPVDPNVCLDLSAVFSSGQSRPLTVGHYEFDQLGQNEMVTEGRNSFGLICKTCRCKVLKPHYGTLIDREVREFGKHTLNHKHTPYNITTT